MIKRDISDLPRSQGDDGVPPSKNNFVAQRLAEAWFAKYQAEGHMDKARAIPELPYRASQASMRCDRQLYYALTNEPATEPFTVASAWAMGLGTLVHEHVQDAVQELFPNAITEPTVDLQSIGIPGSGHADLIVDHDGDRVLVELKTTGGFGFKDMATPHGGRPKGPKYSYLLQAGMLAAALGIDKVVIAVLAMESASVGIQRKYDLTDAERFSAEWHYHIDELMPYVEAERERIERVINDVRDDQLPARVLHDPEVAEGAQVTRPLSERAPWMVRQIDDNGNNIVVEAGTTWMCGYCQWRTTCDQAGE